MEIQAIPAIAVSCVWLLNYIVKRQFVSISNFALLYISCAYWGALLLHLNPRTGAPFSDYNAMVFLALNSTLFCLPAVFFNDRRNTQKLEFEIPCAKLKKLAKLLIFITLPGGIFFFCRGIPQFINFLRSGIERDVFREAHVLSSGWDSLAVFLFRLGSCFELTAFFLGLSLLATRQLSRKIALCLLFGGCGFCFDSLGTISRSILFYKLIYSLIVFLLLLFVMSPDAQKKFKKILFYSILILSLPFLLISLRRFNDDFLYSIFSYFSTGPYSFNIDYHVRTEYDVPAANGVLTMGFFSYIYQFLTSTTFYQDGFDLIEAYHVKDNGELSALYRSINGAYCGEFKTAIGSLLLDFSLSGVVIFSSVFSGIFTLYFLLKKNSLARLFMASIYFFILILLPIGWAFAMRNENMQLLVSLIFVATMTSYEIKSADSAICTSDKQKL